MRREGKQFKNCIDSMIQGQVLSSITGISGGPETRLTCGLCDRHSIALGLVFEDCHHHNFVRSGRTQVCQTVSVIASTKDHLKRKHIF